MIYLEAHIAIMTGHMIKRHARICEHTYYSVTPSWRYIGLCQNHRANVKTGKVLIREVVRSPKMKRDPTNMEG